MGQSLFVPEFAAPTSRNREAHATNIRVINIDNVGVLRVRLILFIFPQLTTCEVCTTPVTADSGNHGSGLRQPCHRPLHCRCVEDIDDIGAIRLSRGYHTLYQRRVYQQRECTIDSADSSRTIS